MLHSPQAVLSKEQLRGELLTACPDSPQPQVLVQQDAVLEDAALAAEAEQVAANNVSMWNFNLTCLKKELPDQGSSSPRESESMPDEDGSPCSAFTNIEARPGPVPGSGSIRRIKSSLSETSMASSSDILSAQLSQVRSVPHNGLIWSCVVYDFPPTVLFLQRGLPNMYTMVVTNQYGF